MKENKQTNKNENPVHPQHPFISVWLAALHTAQKLWFPKWACHCIQANQVEAITSQILKQVYLNYLHT